MACTHFQQRTVYTTKEIIERPLLAAPIFLYPDEKAQEIQIPKEVRSIGTLFPHFNKLRWRYLRSESWRPVFECLDTKLIVGATKKTDAGIAAHR